MGANKVFFGVLNMGLGHATRSLPLINEFQRRGWQIAIGSNGRALAFLRNELSPETLFLETPSYEIRYSRSDRFVSNLLFQIPRVAWRIGAEQRFCRQMARKIKPDLIISDNCYGLHHRDIPSYFISHQIYFALPKGWQMFTGFAGAPNRYFHGKYKAVIIPDLPGADGGLLSGELSRIPDSATDYHYTGILSSVAQGKPQNDIDLLISISGPEPQRTILEKRILKDVEAIEGNKVLLLGKPEKSELLFQRPGLRVYSHLPREKMQQMMRDARMIVSRSGYSTLMELLELNKRAFFIPTPGQTEQVYLAERFRRQGHYFSVAQKRLDLPANLQEAEKYPGLKVSNTTADTVRHIFNDILKL